jgi:hypothetical protein
MIHYRQHRPAYFEGFENLEGDVPNVERLLEIEFIKNFGTLPNFHRFSFGSGIETPTGWMVTLMAEYREGYEWWVVAYLWPQHRDELEGLPKWEAMYTEQEESGSK